MAVIVSDELGLHSRIVQEKLLLTIDMCKKRHKKVTQLLLRLIRKESSAKFTFFGGKNLLRQR
jgi:hypothetical protein